jgi:hypothetical protein
VWDELDMARDYMTTTLRPAWERAGITPPTGVPVSWPVHNLVL